MVERRVHIPQVEGSSPSPAPNTFTGGITWLTLRNRYDADIDLGNDETLKITIQRMTPQEFSEFSHRYRAVMRLPMMKLATRTTADEREKRDVVAREDDADVTRDEYVIPVTDILTRRYNEMADSEKVSYNEMVDQHDAETISFAQNVVIEYVEVKPGQMEAEDAEGNLVEATSGAILAQGLAGDLPLMMRIVEAVKNAHQVRRAEKKVSS